MIKGEKSLDYKKKLFYWDFIRIIPWAIMILTMGGRVRMAEKAIISEATLQAFLQSGVPLVGSPATLVDWAWLLFWIPVFEFLTSDGHIWGDFLFILSGYTPDIQMFVWVFSLPTIILLDYLWAYRDNNTAKNLRTANWVIALLAYFIWTVFFPLNKHYDYFVWFCFITYWHWAWWIVLIAIVSIVSMWFGVLLVSGPLIYKQCTVTDKKRAPWIAALLSLGVPGVGQIAIGKYKRGAVFLLLAPLIWLIGLYMYYIPTLILWLYAAYDAKKQMDFTIKNGTNPIGI